MKTCPKCATAKDASNFSPSKTHRNKLSGWCKVCKLDAVKVWKKANPEAVKRQYDRRYAKLRGMNEQQA